MREFGGGGGGAQDLGRRQRMRACGTINIYPPPPGEGGANFVMRFRPLRYAPPGRLTAVLCVRLKRASAICTIIVRSAG